MFVGMLGLFGRWFLTLGGLPGIYGQCRASAGLQVFLAMPEFGGAACLFTAHMVGGVVFFGKCSAI